MSESLYVKVTKASEDGGWYDGRIGEVFEVNEVVSEHWGEVYYVDPPASPGGRRYISKENAVELTQVKRQANVGEHILIVDEKGSFGKYGNGDVLAVDRVDDEDLDGVRVDSVATDDYDGENYNPEGFITDDEYVVLAETGAEACEETHAPHVASTEDEEGWPELTDECVQASAVEHPSHYNSGDIETIEIIEEITKGYEGYEGFCIGNVVKYIHRAPFKGNKRQDIEKAIEYLKFALEQDTKGDE